MALRYLQFYRRVLLTDYNHFHNNHLWSKAKITPHYSSHLHLKERTGLMAESIFVYRGFGANEQGCEQLSAALKRHLSSDKYTIDFISPEEIINNNKLRGAALICFGGGFTSGFAKALGDPGMSNLKAYVHNGGNYLGFGAGGYFGCDYIEFDVGGPLEKFSERDIRFFPGIGRGPVYPGFEYGTNKGVHAVSLTFSSSTFNGTFYAYIDGGGAFINSEFPKPGSDVIQVTSIATFHELDGAPAAIVKSELKNGGKAILSGVHLEYDTLSKVGSDSNLASLHDDFANSKESQDEALKSLLLLLGLKV